MAGKVPGRIKALAVVTDGERDEVIVPSQPRGYFCGSGMLYNVVQRFLGDAVEDLLGWERQIGFRSQISPYVELMASTQGCGLFFQCNNQAFRGQRLGPQFKDQRTHLRKPRLGQLKNVGEWLVELALGFLG